MKKSFLFLALTILALRTSSQTAVGNPGAESTNLQPGNQDDKDSTLFDFKRIEDNSFLIEEAYNQEPGVIQHISGFQYMKDNTWAYNFTEEWPCPGQKHQISTTIPYMYNQEHIGLGDMALNYRYQAILSKRTAFAPRFSILLPSGNYKQGLGYGVFSYQTSLPLSFIVSRSLVTHFNLGATISPNIKSDLDEAEMTNINKRPNVIIVNYGASVIVLLSETFNFLFEIVGNTTITAIDKHLNKSYAFFFNPGFRYAINCKSGLQIVPGIAAPIGVGSSSGSYGIYAYLSFEHPLWKP